MRLSWSAQYDVVDGEAVEVQIYRDEEVDQVIVLLMDGEWACRMMIGLYGMVRHVGYYTAELEVYTIPVERPNCGCISGNPVA